MIIVSPMLIVVLLVLVVFFGFLLVIFFRNPKNGKKIVEKVKIYAPYSYWAKDGSMDGLVPLLIFLVFLMFSCMLCFQLYGLAQNIF